MKKIPPEVISGMLHLKCIMQFMTNLDFIKVLRFYLYFTYKLLLIL